jgi:hypothetical protein
MNNQRVDDRIRPLIQLQTHTHRLLASARADLDRGHASQTADSVRRIEQLAARLDARVSQLRNTLTLAA